MSPPPIQRHRGDTLFYLVLLQGLSGGEGLGHHGAHGAIGHLDAVIQDDVQLLRVDLAVGAQHRLVGADVHHPANDLAVLGGFDELALLSPSPKKHNPDRCHLFTALLQ